MIGNPERASLQFSLVTRGTSMCRNTLPLCNNLQLFQQLIFIPDSGPSCQSPSLILLPSTLTSITTFLTLLTRPWFILHAMSLWPVWVTCPARDALLTPYCLVLILQLFSALFYNLSPTARKPFLNHLTDSPSPTFLPFQQQYSTNFPLLSGDVLGVSLKFL